MARAHCCGRNQATEGKDLTAYLVLDSSVIVAALRQAEESHQECFDLLEKVKNGHFIVLEPCSVLIEVVAAIKRRSGSTDLAERVKKDLLDINALKFLELTSHRAEQAAAIASKIAVRGMDAVVIQLAREFDSPLVTLDMEMKEKAKSIVKIEAAVDLVTR